MQKASVAICDVIDVYKKYVINNPQEITKYETLFRYASYILTGRFEDSELLAELSYALSNVLSLIHDFILRHFHKIHIAKNLSSVGEKLLRILSVIEASEVVLELAGKRLGKSNGRWLAVLITQLTKCFLRLRLLLNHKSGIQTHPHVQLLDRTQLDDKPRQAAMKKKKQFQSLGKSSRIIRNLEFAPSAEERSWRVPNGAVDEQDAKPTQLNDERRRAEILYICRPLIHLCCCAVFGLESWKSWSISLGLDVFSLWSMDDTNELNLRERQELRKRLFYLCLYLLRSPCYDRFSREWIVDFLRFLSMYVPLTRIFTGPVLEYLPIWQRLYSYNWSQ